MKKKVTAWIFGTLAVLIVLVIVVLVVSFARGAFGYKPVDTDGTGGTVYYYNPWKRDAFIAAFEMNDYIAVPDEMFGYKITSLGGFHSRGVPAGFGLNAPGEWRTKERFDEDLLEDMQKSHPDAEVYEYTVDIWLGRNVKDIKSTLPQCFFGYDDDHREAIWIVHYSFRCDSGNKTFCSDDGKLYRRENNSLVEDFMY